MAARIGKTQRGILSRLDRDGGATPLADGEWPAYRRLSARGMVACMVNRHGVTVLLDMRTIAN
jgi:hypothetical protein